MPACFRVVMSELGPVSVPGRVDAAVNDGGLVGSLGSQGNPLGQ